ncbi:hypothetical protein EBU99_07070 [bacterium]|nr:hypothetical protein [bacterium]
MQDKIFSVFKGATCKARARGFFGHLASSAIVLFASSLPYKSLQPVALAANTSSPQAQQQIRNGYFVPLELMPDFWSKEAKLLSYRCKDLKLIVRSRISPSIEYKVSESVMSEATCHSTVKAIQSKGCFCDGGVLKCIETEKIEPWGFVCASPYLCMPFRGEQVGVLRVKDIGNFFTPQSCQKELDELER